MTDTLVEQLLRTREYDPVLMGKAAARIVLLEAQIKQLEIRNRELDVEILRVSRNV